MSKSIPDATIAAKEYLYSTNRPYSSNDIFNNLQNKFAKTAIMKALDSLVSTEDICEKLNGKQKIYFANQNKFIIDSNKMTEMEKTIEEHNKLINKLNESISDKEQKIKSLKNHVPIAELKRKLSLAQNEVQELKNKFDKIDSSCKNIDPKVHTKIKQEHEILVNEWKKRKRLATEVMGMILENYPKPKKAFIEEVGVETDEDVNVVIPS